MIKGINATEELIIKKILKPYQQEFKFFYYGSRVKGNFEKASDLQIKLDKNMSELNDLYSTYKKNLLDI